jgi:hypothetical protein
VFPSSNSEIFRNGAGEPTGWSAPESADTYYCDSCGFNHPDGQCPEDDDEDVEYYAQKDQKRFEEGEAREAEQKFDNDHRFEEKGVDGYEL